MNELKKARKMKTEESRLERQVEDYMKKRRVWQLARYQAQSNQNGIPDRLYLYKGFLLGLELKTKKGNPTALQLKKIKAINDNGGIGIIVTDIDIIIDLLNIIDKYEGVFKSADKSVLVLDTLKLWKREEPYSDD
jgi:hypothetical protein